MIYTFETYTLDTDCYELRRAGILCPLEPHALDILAYLLVHRDRVVTKHELLEHLWPQRCVSEGILTQRVMMIRRALGDSGQSQHCIKTIHGRGYRFVAPVAVHAPAPRHDGLLVTAAPGEPARYGDVSPAGVVVPDGAPCPASVQVLTCLDGPGMGARPRHVPLPLFRHPPRFVGRETALAQLAQWWTTVQQGRRQIGVIVGEPGIGKTALVEAFVAHVSAHEDIWVGHGQCLDCYGVGEAYLPVLEALGRLGRGPAGAPLVTVLRQYAPSWLVHLPALLALEDRERLGHLVGDVTPARMLRELAEALEVLTAIRPLVLVLEDLHWSDRATLEWLAYVVRRRDAARLLLLGTYRPVEAMVPVPPLRALLAELQHHPQYAELRLDALSEVAVAAYLRQRCGMEPGTAGLPQLVRQRTGGHPLFLVAMVDELVRQRLLETAGEAGWSPKDLAGLREVLPASLRQYIEQHLEQVPEADQTLLEAASVAGSTFAVAAVAAGVTQAPETLEARYTALARQGRFIRTNGTETWPDGTVTACYQFRHALYHEVVYARVSAGLRMRLHQQIGMRKETGYGARAHEIAAELAVHFERGRDPDRAIQYLQHAADSALRRSAYTDAITHLTNALALLTVLPETAERAQRELDVQLTLGPALMATKGMAAPAVEQTYAHARALCQQAGDTPQLLRVLFGLWQCYLVRGEVHVARELAAQSLSLAQHQHDPATLLVAHWVLGVTLFYLGEFTLARAHAEQGIVLSNAQQPYTHVCFYGQAPGIGCLGHMAQALWMLGYPDQAQQRSQEALALARELSHPYDVVFALNQAVVVHQLRREGLLAYKRAEEVLTFCRDQGFTQQLAMGTILQGWGLAAQGQVDRGMAHMHHGLATSQVAGIGLGRAPVLAQLAEVCWHTRQTAEGLRLLTEALAVMDRTGERWWEVEVHRLTGELLLAQEEGTRQQWVEAEAHFQHALEVAYHQQAKSLELRAAMSMSRLWQQQGKGAEAHALLAPIYGWFTEGFDTADLQEAKVLLEELAR